MSHKRHNRMTIVSSSKLAHRFEALSANKQRPNRFPITVH